MGLHERKEATQDEIEQARASLSLACLYDWINVDDPARVSIADDGVWVAAWVWVPNADQDDDESAQ